MNTPSLRESVLTHINHLLNSVNPYNSFNSSLGLHVYQGELVSDQLFETLRTEIKRIIVQHEPRLKLQDITIELEGNQLFFKLIGILNQSPWTLNLSIERKVAR